jgi:hypothetical protein
MKICPNCQRTYTDDGLNFCLDDGSILSQTNSNSLPATVLINEARPTSPNQQHNNEVPTKANWNNQAAYSMQPKKSSKTWIWVLGILGALALLCGGGFVGFVAWVGTLDTNTNSKNNANTGNFNSVSTSNANTTSNDRTDVDKIDLNDWVITDSEFGVTECTNGELTMSSRKKGFYYVIAGTESEKTESATSRVTLKNIEQANSTLGYGIVVHSDTTPLKQSYAFLIDTVKKRYRVVYHQPGKETAAINWTSSSAIKGGTEENLLEVRDENGKMDFYINGNLITSVKNVYGYKGGVIGLYSSDAVKIVFSNLEIRK